MALARRDIAHPTYDLELQLWWEDKFRLPFSHSEGMTTLELERAYWQDYYRQHPGEAKQNEHGELETDDAIVNALERSIRDDREPTQEELRIGLSERQRKQLDLEHELFTRMGIASSGKAGIRPGDLEGILRGTQPLPGTGMGESGLGALSSAPAEPPAPELVDAWKAAVSRARSKAAGPEVVRG